jgi:hypothetical protein
MKFHRYFLVLIATLLNACDMSWHRMSPRRQAQPAQRNLPADRSSNKLRSAKQQTIYAQECALPWRFGMGDGSMTRCSSQNITVPALGSPEKAHQPNQPTGS